VSPALSVCVCTYNRPEWVRGCVLSVLRSRHVDLEVLLVDNGSEPATMQVLDELLTQDPRVHVWRLERNDQEVASQLLHSLVRGRYVLHLPDDDLIVDPFWLGTAVAALDQDPTAGLCWSWTQDMTFDDRPLEQVRGDRFEVVEFDDLFSANYVPMSACVFRAEFKDEELVTRRYFGEWDLWLRILRHHRGISVPRVTTMLRQHAGAESQAGLLDGGFVEAHLTVWRYWMDRGTILSDAQLERMLQVLASLVVYLPAAQAAGYLRRFEDLVQKKELS